MTKYRILRNEAKPSGYAVQLKNKYWPFWTSVKTWSYGVCFGVTKFATKEEAQLWIINDRRAEVKNKLENTWTVECD